MNRLVMMALTLGALASYVAHGQVSTPTTNLDVDVITYPEHDGDPGSTRLVLTSHKDSSELYRKSIKGLWVPIGFSARTNTYVLGGMFQRGGWLPMVTVNYLDATNVELRPSSCSDWIALSSVASPSGKYIAFVGSVSNGGITDLFVLDAERDTIVRIGSPPKPPPLSADERGALGSRTPEWGWGDPPNDTHVAMDPGIIVWTSDDALTVSYGNDTSKQRAKSRRKTTWSMKKVFGE